MKTRKLGNMEHALLITHDYAPFVVSSAVRMINGPPPERVRAALDVLQARQPALRARIRRQKGGPFLEVVDEPPPIPLIVREREDDEHWHRLAAAELNAPLPVEEPPLMRCHYLYSPEADAPSELIITIVHIIIDAVSGGIFYKELLELSTMAGSVPPPELARPLALLPATDALFPPSFQGRKRLATTARYMARQMADEFQFRRGLRGIQPLTRHEGVRCTFLSASLPEETTTQLARTCRRRRLSLGALLLAASLQAINKHVYAGQAMPLRYLGFNNLRPFLSTRIPDELVSSYIAMSRYTAFVAPGQDVWALARATHDDMYQAGKRGDKYVSAALAPLLIRGYIHVLRDRMCQGAVSHIGALPLQPVYGDTRILGVHGCSSSDAFAPEYSVFSKILFGRLCWDAVYMPKDMDEARAQAITDDIVATLIKVGHGEH